MQPKSRHYTRVVGITEETDAELLLDRFRVPSIYSRLNDDERKLRFAIQDYIISHGGPVSISDAGKAAGIDEYSAKRIARCLVEKGAVVTAAETVVKFAYPVSALPTCHVVTLADSRRFYAMCAIDALGSHFTFMQDIRIDSKCHHCGESIWVQVSGGMIAAASLPTLHVLHVDLNKYENWATST